MGGTLRCELIMRSICTYSLLVLAKGGVDHAHVEENLARVSNLGELVDGVFELIVVVAG